MNRVGSFHSPLRAHSHVTHARVVRIACVARHLRARAIHGFDAGKKKSQ